MTQQEARQTLGLPDNCSPGEVREKFNDMYNDYQIRLTNAPTPNLKKLYEKNIEELHQALNVLLGDSSNSDLPSSTPVYAKNTASRPNQEPEQAAAKTPKAQASAAPAAPAAKKSNAAMMTIVFLIVAIVAVSSVFSLKYLDVQKQVDDLQRASHENDSLKNFAKNFTNRKFKIKNAGTLPMTVKKIIVCYVNDKGGIEKFYDKFSKQIEPNGVDSFESVKGNQVVWNGAVVSYYMQFEYNGQNNDWSGIWSKDAGSEGTFIINPE